MKSVSNRSPHLPTYSRLPPHALDLEEAVLGAILIEKGAINKVADFLKPRHFYHYFNRDIYEQMLWLDARGEPIDLLQVRDRLLKAKKLGKGDSSKLAALTNRVIGSANIEYHGLRILEKAKARELIAVCNHYLKEGFDDSNDALELIGAASDELVEIQKDLVRNEDAEMLVVAEEIAAELATYVATPVADREEVGSRWPYPSLNSRIGNIVDGDLIIVAARPGMGKTAFALDVAEDLGPEEVAVFFTFEMPKDQLAGRSLFKASRVNSRKMRQRDLLDGHDVERMNAGLTELQNTKLIIVEAYGMTVKAMRAKLRQIIDKSGETGGRITKVIIDYIQLVAAANEKQDRHVQVSGISRELKMLALEFHVPVFALSQLSREVEKRNDKRPKMSDLRESGALEQDADIILALFRPEYYKIFKDSKGRNLRHIVEIIPLKNRHGDSDWPILLYLMAIWGAFFNSREEMEEEEARVKADKEAWEKLNPEGQADLPF